MIRGSICGSFPPREVDWGGIWDQLLENMLVKKCLLFWKCFWGGMGSPWEFWARNWRQIDRNGIL